MNQTARYVIMVLLIIALGIWSITVYRSCQVAKEPTDQIDDTSTETDTADLEDLFVVEEDTTADEFIETDIPENDEDESGNGYTDPESSFDEGEFLVVAGAFIVESNAQKVVNRLHQKGYKDAEIRVFIGSEYHSAIVGAYKNMDDAFDVAIKLADEGYKDVYVHKKRYKKKK